MPTNPSAERHDLDAALAEVVEHAELCRADVNRLVGAAVRLRAAVLAQSATVAPDVRPAELGVLAAVAELAGGRASQNRVIEAHEALMAARVDALQSDDDGRMTNPDRPCSTVAWCEGRCDPTLDEHGTVLTRLHIRSWEIDGPAERVQLAQLTAEPDDALPPAEAAPVIWVDHDAKLNMPAQLSIDQAEQLAAALTAAVHAARRAEQ